MVQVQRASKIYKAKLLRTRAHSLPHHKSWHSSKPCFRYQSTGVCSLGSFCPYFHSFSYPSPKPLKKKYVLKKQSNPEIIQRQTSSLFCSPLFPPNSYLNELPPVSELRLKINNIKKQYRRNQLRLTFSQLRESILDSRPKDDPLLLRQEICVSLPPPTRRDLLVDIQRLLYLRDFNENQRSELMQTACDFSEEQLQSFKHELEKRDYSEELAGNDSLGNGSDYDPFYQFDEEELNQLMF